MRFMDIFQNFQLDYSGIMILAINCSSYSHCIEFSSHLKRSFFVLQEATSATVWTHSSEILNLRPVFVLMVLKLLRENVLILMSVQENRLVEKMRFVFLG